MAPEPTKRLDSKTVKIIEQFSEYVSASENLGPYSQSFLGESYHFLSQENHRKSIEHSINLELGNNNAIIIVISTCICVMLEVIT